MNAGAPEPDQRSGDYQMARALQILNSDDGTGIYRELEEAKLHALLAIGGYLRELTAVLRQTPAPVIEMVPAARVAEMTADIIHDLQQQQAAKA